MHLRRLFCSWYVELRSIALIVVLIFTIASLGTPVESRAQSLPGQMSLQINRSITNHLNYWFETPTQRLTEPKELRRSPGNASVLLDASIALNKPNAYL